DADDPALLVLADQDVGDYGPRLERADLRAGARIEAADQLHGDSELDLGTPQRFQQACMVARGHEAQAALSDIQGKLATRRARLENVQLRREAFAQVARCDAAWLERLDDA